MNLCLDIENVSSCASVPGDKELHQWALAALMDYKDEIELSIRIVDEQESAELNQRYRQKTGSTNVLSFPADLPESLGLPLLGDLVICAPVVKREAQQQGKTSQAHWAHMVVHGSLHLMGYDHIDDRDADAMEQLETDILTSLNFPPPYESLPGVINS